MNGVRFPKFKTMVSAVDFEQILMKLLDITVYDREKAESVFKEKIIMDSNLPPGTALLIDKNEKIVAVIQDRKVVEIK